MIRTDCFAYRSDDPKDGCGALNRLYCKCEECHFYRKADEVNETVKELIGDI